MGRSGDDGGDGAGGGDDDDDDHDEVQLDDGDDGDDFPPPGRNFPSRFLPARELFLSLWFSAPQRWRNISLVDPPCYMNKIKITFKLKTSFG